MPIYYLGVVVFKVFCYTYADKESFSNCFDSEKWKYVSMRILSTLKRLLPLLLALLLSSCQSGDPDGRYAVPHSEAVDFANVSDFSKNELVSYLKSQSVDTYRVLQTTISARAGEDHRFTAVYLLETTDEKGNSVNFSYGFYLLRHSSEKFEVLDQGMDVDSSCLGSQIASESAE